MQLVCRDRNRLALEADLVGASMHGIENICCLTGDDVTAGDEPEARRVFDLDSAAAALDRARRSARGRYLSGRAISPAPHFFLGAVENPGAPPLDYRVRRAAKKALAGARLPAAAALLPARAARALHARGARDRPHASGSRSSRRSASCARSAGCGSSPSSVPGIDVPPETLARVEQATDAEHECFEIAYELASHALAQPGVAGLHFISFRKDAGIAKLCRRLGIPTRIEREANGHSASVARLVASTIGAEQPFCIIGERINPTGPQDVRRGAAGGRPVDRHGRRARPGAGRRRHARRQRRDPARRRARAAASRCCRPSRRRSTLPICIDSSVIEALEAGLSVYEGRALVNSVTAEDERLEEILPLVARHGAAVIGLANDETGIPETPQKRLECARKIVAAADDHGIADRGRDHRPAGDDGRRRHRGGDDHARDDLA